MTTDSEYLTHERRAELIKAWHQFFKGLLPHDLTGCYHMTLSLPYPASHKQMSKTVRIFLSRLQHNLHSALAAVGLSVKRIESTHAHLALVTADEDSLDLQPIEDLQRIVKEQWRKFQHRSDADIQADKIFSTGGAIGYMLKPWNFDLTDRRSMIIWHNGRLLQAIRERHGLKPARKRKPKPTTEPMVTIKLTEEGKYVVIKQDHP